MALKHWRLSVTQRLFVLTAAALLPMIAILFFNILDLRRGRETEVQVLALRFGQLASLEMERIVTGAEAVLRVIAASPDIGSDDAAACGRYLAAVTAQLPQFTGVSVIDSHGIIRCRSDAAAVGSSLADRSYFSEVMRTGTSAVGEYTTSRVSGAINFPIAVPILKAGATVGVVAGGIDLQWLGERLRDRDFLKGSALTVADRNGIILAREPQPERFVGTRIPDPFIALVTAQAPGTQEVASQDGTRRIIGYYPATISPVGLYVSAGISRDMAFGSIDEATSRGVFLAIAAACLAFAVAWATGRGFIRQPVGRIVGTIAAWRTGDEEARTGMDAGGGEIETVGVAIDLFLQELSEGRRERRRHEEQRELMVRELDHRVKNIVAMVQSVARQTFRGGDAATAARLETFSSRLAAMSRAHEMLMLNRWSSAEIGQAVDAPLSLYGGRSNGQFQVIGPSLVIKPKAALALSMAVHELCTNAAKYGALGSDAGRIAISWGLKGAFPEQIFWFDWTESDGPPVAPPDTAGFGSRMITRALAAEISARVELSFPPTGAVCHIEASAENLLLGSDDEEARVWRDADAA